MNRLNLVSGVSIGVILVTSATATGQGVENNSVASSRGKIVTTMRTERPPTIDGILGEGEWRDAAVIKDMHQFSPVDHADPSEPTHVYVLYDDHNIYIAARMWDNEPEQIRARQMVQGGTLQFDDSFGVYLDPYNNSRTGYNFQVNPNGVRTEGIFETPTRLNRDWKGIWHAESLIDDEGWTTEIAIPLKTLNFNPDNTDWGFTIERTIARKQEDIAWVSYNRQVNPGTTGTISGLTGLKQGKGLDLVPSMVMTSSREFDQGATSSDTEPALDVVYNFTPSLKGLLTLNTDFSAAEVDNRQINLTRFSPFFPEKRDFFLQDVDIFSFGGLQRNGIPFFSRRIGLSSTGQPVDIEAGAKITGRIGRWNVGLLGVQQDRFEEVDGTNLFVARVAANVLEESSIGMIVTDGDPRTNLDNSLTGFDFRYRNTRLPGGRTLEGEAWYQQSETEGSSGEQSAWGLRVAAPNLTGLSGEMAFDHIEDQFNPALGFVNRRGIERKKFRLGYTTRPMTRRLRAISHLANFERFDRISGGLESQSLYLKPLEIETRSGDVFALEFSRRRDVLQESFEIADGVTIPTGNYSYDGVGFEVEGAPERTLSPSFEYFQQDFFDGERLRMIAGLDWRPNSRFLMGLDYEYNDIALPGGDFIARLIALRANVALNVRWSWLNLVQYDNESQSVGINSRLRWSPRAGQDLMIVVNHGYYSEGAFTGLRSQESQVSIKYTQTFRL